MSVVDMFYRAKFWLSNLRGNLKYNRKVLHLDAIKRRGWVDRDHVMICAAFQTLIDFLDEECNPSGNDYVDWEADGWHKDAMETMRDLEHWWKFDPLAQEPWLMPDKAWAGAPAKYIVAEYRKLYVLPEDADWIEDVVNSALPADRSRPYLLLGRIEKKAIDRQQEMLHKLVDIRPYMWT